MAVDNRNFVNKFANEGGGDVLVEDKRLEELKSATGKTASQISTTTQYIPLQDTDGNIVKINPASFEEAVRNTLGSLLANNDKGTTISGVPALSGSGASLDFGSVTPANLASVLGVLSSALSTSDHNLNNLSGSGRIHINTNTQEWTNTPANSMFGLLVQIGYGTIKVQFVYYVDLNDSKYYIAFRNIMLQSTTWTSWSKAVLT